MPNNNDFPVYLIAIGAFSLGMASYVTAGLIPMIETSFSVAVAVAGQLVTAFTLACGLGSPVIVAAMPAHGQRIGLLTALGSFVIANVGSAVAEDFTTLMVWRAVAGIGAGVYLATGIAAATALSRPERRGKVIAIIMGGMASGVVLGVPIGLLLAERLGWQAALWLVAILGLAALIGLMLKLPRLSAAAASSMTRRLSILADGYVVAILIVSFLAAIASLGMYTFIASLLAHPRYGAVGSVTPYLWVWGTGGVLGSFLIGPLVDRLHPPAITLAIMLALSASLLLLPLAAATSAWLVMLPIAVWGAVGWALQVPQKNELLLARERQGDGNLAVALNESALYLGSAIGAAGGGLLLFLQMPIWTLAASAGAIAAMGALLQVAILRRSKTPDALSSAKPIR